MNVELEEPRVVAEEESRCWYPDILKFSTGELMINYSLNADSSYNTMNTQVVILSDDRGKTWGKSLFPYDVEGFHNAGGEVRVSLPDGRIVGTSANYLRADPPGQKRDFAVHYWCYDRGGRRYSVEPWGARVRGLPRDVEIWPKPTRTRWYVLNWYGDIVVLEDGRFLTTLTLRYEGDTLLTTVALTSGDEGKNWEYLSTVAGAEDIPGAQEGFDEPCLIRLTSGELMCVSRVGKGPEQPLARTFSSDQGKTWSKIDRLPAFSVAPNISQLSNGVIAISTGRPGLFLWLSSEPDGKGKWECIDLIEHHNSSLDNPHKMDVSQDHSSQTTAYTANLEASPNRLYIVYDRTPFGWNAVPEDSDEKSRIYLLEASISIA